MSTDLKKNERIARAKRLVEARREAGFSGAQAVADAIRVNVNNYKAHESGRNGFEAIDGKKYAKAFNVSLKWLMLGEGDKHDLSENITDKPLNDLDAEIISLLEDVNDQQKGILLEILRSFVASKPQ